jgi:TolA-binding protein
LLQLANKNYGGALVQFNRVLNQYGNSNKASAAQFAKAVTLKRMNLNTQAISAFRTVQKQYPGSQEALRAQNELKILGVK